MGRMSDWHLEIQEKRQWQQPLARTTDPETSHEAARNATPTASKGRMAAIKHLSARALTDHELSAASGVQINSIGKRRADCVAAGLVRAATDTKGNKIKRKTRSGSTAIVWEITREGRAFYGKHNRGF